MVCLLVLQTDTHPLRPRGSLLGWEEIYRKKNLSVQRLQVTVEKRLLGTHSYQISSKRPANAAS